MGGKKEWKLCLLFVLCHSVHISRSNFEAFDIAFCSSISRDEQIGLMILRYSGLADTSSGRALKTDFIICGSLIRYLANYNLHSVEIANNLRLIYMTTKYTVNTILSSSERVVSSHDIMKLTALN